MGEGVGAGALAFSLYFSVFILFIFSKHAQLHPKLELEKIFFNMHTKNTCSGSNGILKLS